MKIKYLLFPLLLTLNLYALSVGEKPKEVTISKDNGGHVTDGSQWSSTEIQGKMYVVFYVDPDEKDVNEHFSKALKAKKYNREKFGSIAIINLAATWKPNFIIESILKSKQKEYVDTIYVKDKNKILVHEWNIADDASNILLFNPQGKLLFYKTGAMSEEDMNQVYTLIDAGM